MRQFQVYFRLHEADQWSYGDTYTVPSVAWGAMMLARARGCTAKIVTSPRVDVDEAVLSVRS